MIVSSRTMKPQNVRACATPGTVHFSSLRCPTTSVASVATSRPGCFRTASIRSGAGCPLNASRFSHHSRRPAIANATTVSDQADSHPQDHANLLVLSTRPVTGRSPYGALAYASAMSPQPTRQELRDLAAAAVLPGLRSRRRATPQTDLASCGQLPSAAAGRRAITIGASTLMGTAWPSRSSGHDNRASACLVYGCRLTSGSRPQNSQRGCADDGVRPLTLCRRTMWRLRAAGIPLHS